jgi:FtsP/CotA-like multicopper oxidase with cupredoxin domain
MCGLNGQVPGPIIKVKQGSSIFVNFTNSIDMNSSIHWHGLKLNNKDDGVPGLTQDPVKPGQSYLYYVGLSKRRSILVSLPF